MKAVIAREWCDPEGLAIDDLSVPPVRSGEVLIDVKSAALNFPDVLMIKGTYQVRPELPFTPGFEFAGTIAEVAPDVGDREAGGFEPGMRVMGQTALGAFAEQAVAPSVTVHPVPDGMNDDEAAAFPLVYQTSYFGLAYRGQLRAGETVLVHSAGGGVGLAAVQIAKALGAGRIIGTVGSDAKRDVVLAAGADTVVNYQTEDFVDVVKRETGGAGADVIYDPVGGEVAKRSTKCIAFEGRLVIIGFTSGEFTQFASNHILVKNYSVVGLHWGHYRQMKPERIEQGWQELIELQRKAGFKPIVGARFPMSDVAGAMRHLMSRTAVGKVVLHW